MSEEGRIATAFYIAALVAAPTTVTSSALARATPARDVCAETARASEERRRSVCGDAQCGLRSPLCGPWGLKPPVSLVKRDLGPPCVSKITPSDRVDTCTVHTCGNAQSPDDGSKRIPDLCVYVGRPHS